METEARNAFLFERFKDILSSASKRVYSGSDLTLLVEKLRAGFGFPKSLSIPKFQRSLIDFYLAHAMKYPWFDPHWRVHCPEDIGAPARQTSTTQK